MKKNILPFRAFASSRLRTFVLSCFLLVACCIAPQIAKAQSNVLDWPFDGSEFKIKDYHRDHYVMLQIPCIDFRPEARFYSSLSTINSGSGPINGAGAVIEYTIDGTNWEPLIALHSSNSVGLMPYPRFNNQSKIVTAWILKPGHLVYAEQTICSQYGRLHGGRRLVTGNPDFFEYNSTTHNTSAPGQVFAAFQWFFDQSIPQNCVIQFRMHAIVRNWRGSNSPTISLQQTWIIPDKIVRGNPISEPVVEALTASSFRNNGEVTFSMKVPNFTTYNDVSASFPSRTYVTLEQSNGGKNEYKLNSAGPYTPTNPVSKTELNNGIMLRAVIEREDYHWYSHDNCNPSGTTSIRKRESAWQRTIKYPQPTNLEAQYEDGKFTLIWDMVAGDPNSPTDGYRFQWRRGNMSWQELEISKNYNRTITKESVTFSIAEKMPGVLNSGSGFFVFRVRRAGIDWDMRGSDGNLFEADYKTNVMNTNNANVYANAEANNEERSIALNITLGSGITSSDWTLKVTRFEDGIAKRTWESLPLSPLLMLIDEAETGQPNSGPAACTGILYQVQMMDGSTVISECYSSKEVMLQLDPTKFGKITNLTASKGFFNDKILIRWNIQGSDFTKYSIHRKNIMEPDGPEQFVTEFPSTGLSTYSFEDQNALAGKIYTYFVRGYVVCNDNTYPGVTKEVNGYMQPMGMASGRVTYKGSNAAMPNANIIVEYVPDGEGDEFENKAFAGADDLMIVLPTITPGLGGTLDKISKTNSSVQMWFKSKYTYSPSTSSDLIWKVGEQILFYNHNSGKFSLYFKTYLPGYTTYFTYITFDSIVQPPVDKFVHITTTLSVSPSQVVATLYIDGGELQQISVHPANLNVTMLAVHTRCQVLVSAIGGQASASTGNNFAPEYTSPAYVDEFRHWNKTLTREEIANNYNRHLNGREQDLFIYYRFDEPGGREVFDISGRNQVYNENHGLILKASGGSSMFFRCTQNVPTQQQLAIRGFTDAQGNYTINSIPYGEYGSSYRIKPLSAGTFVPENHQFIFSQASPVANNMNFVNESIYTVSGTVKYRGGVYPVEGCYFEVDGMIANINGVPITSRANGTYDIPVPVGVRSVQVKKVGHSFIDNGFILDHDNGGGHYNYIKNESGFDFIDTTLVKVIGHVVGGKVEHDKVSGHGLRKNNIGSEKITLVLEKEFNLSSDQYDNPTESTQTFLHHKCRLNSNQWKTIIPDFYDPTNLVPVRTVLEDYTTMTINGKTITIEVSPETGEFVAWLPPERYNVSPITAGLPSPSSFTYDVTTSGQILDLTSSVVINKEMYRTSILQWQRNDFQPDTLNGPGWYKLVDYADTVFYNAELGNYYQPRPTFTVKQEGEGAEVDYLGENTYKLNDTGDPVDLAPGTATGYNHLGGPGSGYLLQMPVFVQGKSYIMNLKAFEEYFNPHSGKPKEVVPIMGGSVNFQGDLLTDPVPPTITLDEKGEGKFRLVPGEPSLTTGIKSFSALLSIAGRPFYINGTDEAGGSIKAILFGGSSTGSNFLTAAADDVDIILHDPPGSNSYAYIESGTSVSTVKTYKHSHEEHTVQTVKLILGGETISLAGLGAMLGGRIESFMDKNEFSTKWQTDIDDQTTINTVQFNSTLKTSASPDYVGHMGDVFVGTGVNTIYGKVFSVDIVPNNQIQPTHAQMTPPISFGGYTVIMGTGIAFGPTFQTTYYFTTHDIENIMIPKWEEVKRSMLKNGYDPKWNGLHDDLSPGALDAFDYFTNPGQLYDIDTAALQSPVYVSKVPPSHPLFGATNCDSRWNNPVFNPAYPTVKSVEGTNGPSYKRILDPKTALAVREALNETPIDPSISGEAENPQGTIIYTDSIVYFNEQVTQWKTHLALNEQRKVDLIGKYEVGNNISFGGGATVGKSVTEETSETWMKSRTNHKHNFINEKGGYVFYGFGIETHKVGNEWINVTNGHGGNTTSTYTTGFVLDENGLYDQLTVDFHLSDFGVDVPTFVFRTRGGQTSCPFEDKVVTKYYPPPSGGTTIMEETMKVENPKIEANPSQLANVPASTPAVFTLTLSNESHVHTPGWFILRYDDLNTPAGAVLKIDGQPIGSGRHFYIPAMTPMIKTLHLEKGEVDEYNAIKLTLSSVCDPSQYDSTFITAKFIPSCSSVEMTAPSQNWVVNIAREGKIDIVLQNHNPNYRDFGYIVLQERRVGDPEWTTLRRFYYNSARHAAAGENPDYVLWTDPNPAIRYTWQVHSKPDGEYEFRAGTVCEAYDTLNNSFIYVSDFYTEGVRGYVDMNPPRVMGVSPANGILSAGDEISITFNEDIQAGMLNQYNFTISGILNDSKIDGPPTGLNFSGDQSAQTQMNIFTNGNFSIETWFNRKLNTAGTLFAYGQGSKFLSLEFDINGVATLRMGTEEYTQAVSEMLNPAINNLEVWRYVGLGYNRETNQVTVSMFTTGDTPTPYYMFTNQQLTIRPETQGILIVGNNHTEDNGFTGAVAYTHFYAQFRDLSQISGTQNKIKSGSEHGIIGYWMMDEGEGNIAKDKVRGRNIITQNANWYNYPVGYALNTGNENPFHITTSSYSFDAQSDFTVEFWFRSDGTTQAGQTLMSGRKAILAVSSTGGLVLLKPTLIPTQTGDTISIITNTNLMNGTWQHFAMSVRRNGSVNVFINGETAAVFSEKLIDNFATARLYFGAKSTYQNAELEVPVVSHHFPGLFDEIRIWNSPLSKETVKERRNFKLHGNEAGLQAYYPFEKYNRANNGIVSIVSYNLNLSLDEYLPNNDTLQAIGGTPVLDGAPVNDVKPVEEVLLTYVASNNKIVLNMAQGHFARVEGVTLNIAVRNIRDMRGNVSSVENWTVFVRRNAIRWDEDPINIVMEEGDMVTFTARIINTGGSTVNYIITDLPAWLSVTPNAGSLPPMGSRILTFTINSAINAGNYEHNIGLSSGNGVIEQLPLQVKVRKERPDWKVNPNDFGMSMSMIGRITINDLFTEDPEDLLGAFIGDLCVGLASPEYNSIMKSYYVFLTVYGNAIHAGKPITFKVWKAQTGEIFPAVETSMNGTVQNFTFAHHTMHGSPAQPVIFKALTGVRQQEIALKAGWNMISTNVTYDNPAILEQMQNSLFEVCVLIKEEETGFMTMPFETGWEGSLQAISEKTMYWIQTNSNHNLSLIGHPVPPLTTLIPLKLGFNRIGYTPNVNLPVMEALTEANPKHGDVIKDQTSFATYYITSGSEAWIGSLTHMFPGRGYLYTSTDAAQKTFFYPDHTSKGEASEYEPVVPLKWETKPQNYGASMSMLAIVADGDKEIRSNLFEIAVFNGETCIGSTLLVYEEMLDRYVGYLMIYGNNNETVTFKAFNHATATEHAVTNESLQFAQNAMIGTPAEPFVINLFQTTVGITQPTSEKVSVHPNPARNELFINHPWKSIDHVEVLDMTGRVLIRHKDFAKNSINISTLASGMYMLKVISRDEVISLKFVKE